MSGDKEVLCGFCGAWSDNKKDRYFIQGSGAAICEPCIAICQHEIYKHRFESPRRDKESQT